MARQQRELIPPTPLAVEPAPGGTEPRLWVSRLVIWSEPGTRIREIKLRPGLNIVWSPDAADRGESKGAASSMGHGSGKTLFCRLLRYCLGEDRFAPDWLRESIATAYKDGLVGVEAFVDGRKWAIVRPIGLTRRTTAVCDGDLEELAAGSAPSTGMAPFLAAVESAILSDAAAALAPDGKAGSGWLTALAWLSRDQECRFDRVLDWRSAASDSGSPVRSLGDADRLEALRTFLRALTHEEQALRREVGRLGGRCEVADRERGLRTWAVTQQRQRIASVLSASADDAPMGALAVDYFKKQARARLASVAVVSSTDTVQDLDALRRRYEETRDRYESLKAALAALEASIPEQQMVLEMIRGELAPFSFKVHGAEHPTCQICEVPVDRVLAEGCKLSHKLPDLGAIRARHEGLARKLENEEARLDAARSERDRIWSEASHARDLAEASWRKLQAAERARDSRSDEWYAARRTVEEVDRLAELLASEDAAAAEVATLDREIERKREQIAIHREQQAKVFQHASKHFDAIVRELVEPDARGRITLDGNGLHLGIELGGDRSTAAIDSLKVLAFDLAALCMSIEGRTHVPPFLVHDSPREADLGLSMYHRLFELIRKLEKLGRKPLFQYIITTTTRPPDELCIEPWLAATLEGMPAEKRLLARDL